MPRVPGPLAEGRAVVELPRDAQSDPRSSLAPAEFRGQLAKALIECVSLAERDAASRRRRVRRPRGPMPNRPGPGSRTRPGGRTMMPILLETIADHLTTLPVAAIGDPRLALELAQKALELKPKDRMARQSLAWAQYRNGDWKG